MSSPGKVLRVASNYTTYSTACAGPRQFLWVLTLRSYSPGGILNALTAEPTIFLPTPSIHRLRCGLPGYLILFAPHTFVPQRQLLPRKSPSPLVFLLISTHFTATLGIPLSPSTLKKNSFSCSSSVEPRDFTYWLIFPPTHPLHPINPDNARPICITAAAGTYLARASSCDGHFLLTRQ